MARNRDRSAGGDVFFDPSLAGPAVNARVDALSGAETSVASVRPAAASRPAASPRATNAAVQSRTATAAPTSAAPSTLANTAGERGRAALSGISSTAKAGAGQAVGGQRKGKIAVAGR